MQAAKKLVLLDEQDREYKRLQRPTAAVAKTRKSLELTDTLRDPFVADDCKVKQYIAALHRYLNVRKEVPEEASVSVNPLTDPTPISRSRKKRKRKQTQLDQY